ncbi:hypothetical protein [Candidatus Hydrogenosomobacter endosymbioticus]|nr:hypothetical protein [Candidatus Hydrogenosomobacter endosymbioticus]
MDSPRNEGQRLTEKRILASEQFLLSQVLHDVASPMSAILAGIELLSDADDETRKDVSSLLIRSSMQIRSTFVFLRAVFGYAGRVADFSKNVLYAKDFLKATTRITLDIDNVSVSDPFVGQLVFAIVLWFVKKSSTKSGVISAMFYENSIKVSFVSDKIALLSRDEEILTGRSCASSASESYAEYIKLLAEFIGASVSFCSSDGEIAVNILLRK